MLNLYHNNKEVHRMIGTVEVRCCAAQPQKPLAPVFSFKDSPQSFRILDVPKSIGTWELTRVYVGLNYPDNTNVEKNATRQGNVWVVTVEGCPIAGKTMGGFTIYADGTDESGNEVTGYVLGNGDCYVLEKSEKISALVGKSTMRILDDIPSTPAKGDVVIVNGVMKIYDGEEWYNVEVDLSDYYTKAEIDEKVDEIDSSISALGDEIPTKTSDLENDSGYITSADIPPIPTKTSDLTNDSGFLTEDDISGKRDYIDLTLDCTGCLEDRPNDYDHSPLHEDLPHCGIDAFNLEWTYPDEQRGLASMFVYYPEGEYNHRQKEWHTFDNLMPFEVWYIQPALTAQDPRWKFHLKSGSYPTWETILEFTPKEIAEAGDDGLPVTITEAGSEYDARLKVKYANSPITTAMTVDEKIEDRIGLALRGINY